MYASALREDTFKAVVENYRRDIGPLTDDEARALREGMLNPSKFNVSVDKEWTLQALSFHDDLAPIFFKMNWTVMRAQAPRYFITSDNPVVFRVPVQHRDPVLGGGGLMDPKVQLTFPLSADRCLLATWEERAPKEITLDADRVKFTNKMRAVYARRFLFGPIRDAGVEALGVKYKDRRPSLKISGFGPADYSPVSLRRK
jgi:hypothetical protein